MDLAFDNAVDSPTSAYLARVALAGWATVPACVQPVKAVDIALTYEGVMGDRYIAELGQLGDDWDGYGASAIESQIATQARETFSALVRRLPAPDISPNPNGTISLEWSTQLGTAHLEIGKSDGSFYLKPNTGESYYLKTPLTSFALSSMASLISSQIYADQAGPLSIGNFSFGSDGARV